MGLRRSRTSEPSEVRTADQAVPLPIWQEMLVGIEMVYLRLSPVYWGFGIPPGDGSAVVVIPAFLMTDLYLTEFRSWINRIGYKAYYSGIGMNAECPNLLIQHKLTQTIEKAYKETGRKIHLVGHSLGGVIARAAAHQMPDRIASVITLGSPFRGVSVHQSILRAAQLVRGQILERHGDAVLPACYTAGCTCNFLESLVVKLPKSSGGDRHLYEVRWNRGLAGLPDRQSRRRFRSLGNPHRAGLQSDCVRRGGPPAGRQDSQLGQSGLSSWQVTRQEACPTY